VLTNPNALITDIEEMEQYQPQGPGVPVNSLHRIVSGMNKGPAFAEADGAAGERLYQFCVSAQQGITGYINEAARSSRIYLDADQTSTAGIQGIIEPVSCVSKAGVPAPVDPVEPRLMLGPVMPRQGGK
jgi:hypothetical protein